MRSMLKSALVALIAILAVSAIASASASAASPEWATCTSPTGWSDGVRYATKGECEKEEHPGTTGEWEWSPLTTTVTADMTGIGFQKFDISGEGGIIECTTLKGRTYYDNKNLEGPHSKNETVEAVYTGCKVTKPSGCTVIHSPGEPNGTIKLAEHIPSKLVTKTGVIYDEIEQNAAGEFVTIDLETAEGSGKPCGIFKLINKLKGSMVAKVNGQYLEFEGKSGEKPLEINTIAATYNANLEQKLEGGGEIKALEES